MPSEQRFSAPPSRFAVGSAGIPRSSTCCGEGKPASFIKNALTLPENEFPAWVKVGAISTPSSFSTRLDLWQGLSPAAARCAVRWTRSPHRRTPPHRAGGTYPAPKSAALPSDYPALPRRSSLRRRPSPRCVPPRSRCVLRSIPCRSPSSSTVLCFHDRPDQLIHLVIRRPILSHKAVVPTGIFVPEILVFLHRYHSFQC